MRKLEDMRSQAEDCLLQIAGLTAQGANVENIQAAALRLQRQLVREIGGTVLQMRMAAAEGMELADKIFSPVAGYDELQEDQAKAFKEYKKEQEKENKAKAQQAARGGGGGRGYGGYRGRGYYNYQPYTIPQQYGQQAPVMMQQVQQQPGFAGQQQAWPPAQQQVAAPAYSYQVPPPQYWHPDGFVGGRGGILQYRPERSVAKCYGCGVLGHYNKDNRCLPGAKEAYQALQASMQSGQQNQQLAIAGPDGN